MPGHGGKSAATYLICCSRERENVTCGAERKFFDTAPSAIAGLRAAPAILTSQMQPEAISRVAGWRTPFRTFTGSALWLTRRSPSPPASASTVGTPAGQSGACSRKGIAARQPNCTIEAGRECTLALATGERSISRASLCGCATGDFPPDGSLSGRESAQRKNC